MENFLLIFLGGGFGCAMRYLVSISTYNLVSQKFPCGTMVVNVTGSFLIGLLSIILLERFSTLAPQFRSFLLIGFLGGYTTFSSFSLETISLFEQGRFFYAFLNIGLSVFLGLIAVWLGIILGRQL